MLEHLSKEKAKELDDFLTDLDMSIYKMTQEEKDLLGLIRRNNPMLLTVLSDYLFEISPEGREFIKNGGYQKLVKSHIKQKIRNRLKDDTQILKNLVGIISFIYFIADVFFTLIFKKGIALYFYHLITGG